MRSLAVERTTLTQPVECNLLVRLSLHQISVHQRTRVRLIQYPQNW